jgi:hypothetical protein
LIIFDDKISDAIVKANELAIKTKQDLTKLDNFIFNQCQIKFTKNKNKLNKSLLGLLFKEQLLQSEILSDEKFLELMSLSEFSSNQK